MALGTSNINIDFLELIQGTKTKMQECKSILSIRLGAGHGAERPGTVLQPNLP